MLRCDFLYFHTINMKTDMYRIIFLFLASRYHVLWWLSETFPTNGAKKTFEPIHAFTNANIVWAPGHTMSNANLLVQGDRILEADSNNYYSGACN